jgi:short-subunit dehydrogenase
MGVPVRTMYCASKFALDGFSASLRGEVINDNITITNIYLSYVQTNISVNAVGYTFQL